VADGAMLKQGTLLIIYTALWDTIQRRGQGPPILNDRTCFLWSSSCSSAFT